MQADFKGVHFRLRDALGMLFQVYEQIHGRLEEATPRFEAMLQSGANQFTGSKQEMRRHWQAVLRCSDLHRYIIKDSSLQSIKLEVLEQVWWEPDPLTCWAAVRKILLREMRSLCGLSASPLRHQLEACKQAITNPETPLGTILSAVALFFFDGDQEMPPDTFSIHFLNGRFPAHYWQIDTLQIGGAHKNTSMRTNQISFDQMQWQPQQPLCRRGYLELDLHHALLQQVAVPTSVPANANVGMNSEPLFHSGTFAAVADLQHSSSNNDKTETRQVYCALENQRTKADTQLSLIPMTPQQLLPALQMEMQKRFGAQTVWLYASMMATLTAMPPAALQSIPLTAFSKTTHLSIPHRQLAARLERLLTWLAKWRVTHILTKKDENTLEDAPLFSLLGWERLHQQVAGVNNACAPSGVKLLVDQACYDQEGCFIGNVYQIEPLQWCLQQDPREHPFLVGMCAFLSQDLAQAEEEKPIWQGSAQHLLTQCGLWVSPSSRARGLQVLENDLKKIKSAGWIKHWKVKNTKHQGVWQEEYTIQMPTKNHLPLPNKSIRARLHSA